MGPKKGKDLITDENYWRICIENAPLNDESFSVKVLIMEPAGSDQDRMYLNKFEVFAAEEKRFVIKNICKTETIFMVNQLGGEKKVKDDNLRVFEEGQAYLKEKKDIPPDILALIIKHLILKMKDEYLFIQRQRLEVREGMRQESSTMIARPEVRGTVNVKPPEPPEPPPVQPKSKGKKGEPEAVSVAPEPDEGKKYNTLLRVRGEEWRDKVYVDDFPVDGPNLYVAVTGFIEPFLAGCLVKIGVPLKAVVQIKIDPASIKIPSTLLRSTKRGQSQTDILTEKSLKFWEDLQQLRINRDSADDFKDTAFVIFSPPYWDAQNLSGDPDKIYDELCFLMYDIQDLTRQHEHYLENLDIVKIPEQTEDERFIKYYHQQMCDLPLECVTTYSVLDSILQTVCKSQEIRDQSSGTSLSTTFTFNRPAPSDDDKAKKAETLVTDVFNVLCLTDSNKKKYRITYGEEYENHKDPIVINHGDAAKFQTFHLGNINMDNIVFSMLLGMPVNQLWLKQDRPEGELEAKVNFHVNVLLSCFERLDVETAELNRLLHILSCRKLFNNRSSLKKLHLPSTTISEFKKVYLKRSVLAEPLPKGPTLFMSSSTTTPSFPSMTKSENISELVESSEADEDVRRIRFLFDCPDISELVSAAEIANGEPILNTIDDFEYFEDFTGTRAFQVLREAFNKFNCVDYKYCEVTDCFVLMFFNSHDKDGLAREEWRSHLATPLCLQDFFDFVLEERYDWIKNEEKIYDETLAINSLTQSKEAVNPNASKSCVENQEVSMELLMEGSLKFQEIVKLEEPDEPEPDDTHLSAKKNGSSPSTDRDSSRKTKSSAATKRTSLAPVSNSDESVLVPTKPFQGYDLGDRRVEVFGKDSVFYSNDGTRVSSMYTLLIPSNLEYVVLNVVPGNASNEFWVHRALGDFVTPDILDTCESFRITSKDQVMINIKKQKYEVPIPLPTTSMTDNPKIRESLLKYSSDNLNEISHVLEERTYHSFYVTWPNGLITESIHEENSSVLSHIKQYYVEPLHHLDEEMRCISLNGDVIIFKDSGEIEVLRPNGSFIKITKYSKRVVANTDVLEDHISEASSDKSKKAKDKGKDKPTDKEKEKGKEKPSRLSSKSSKNPISDDESLLASKNLEYELFVEEFEIIETSGLRQKWINDCSFDIEKLLTRTATDYCLGEIFSRRMDGTHILLNKNGVQIVTFPNRTRIITTFTVEDEEIYPEWTEEEIEYFDLFSTTNVDVNEIDTDTLKSKASQSQKSYTSTNYSATSRVSYSSKKLEEEEFKNHSRNDGYISIQLTFIIEHAKFATVTINKANENVTVDSPNKSSVILDKNNHYQINLGSVTVAKFEGENLFIDYEACPECRSSTTCKIKICHDEMCSVTKMQQHWLKLKDSFCKTVVVNEEGCISFMDDTADYCNENIVQSEDAQQYSARGDTAERVDEDRAPDGKSVSSYVSHGKCREMYQAKTMRFFVLRRDLTCSELVHRALLEQYKKACRWQPWCSINEYDTFGDHRSLVSLLTTVHLNETEKWLMDSKMADKPVHLAYKDLKKDTGKGFYQWMRPYQRFEPQPMKPANVLPPRLPRAFVLRTLEKQWKDEERNQLKGARELLNAILRYRRVMESDCETILHVPIVDLRPEDERRTDDIMQALAHRIYEDLKTRLSEDVQSRAKPDVSTRPLPSEELSVEGELEEDFMDDLKILEEERDSLTREAEMAEEMSPNLRRYWRRRAEELKEENFYLYLLREGSVPPYFRNVLGGAIWWEMNNTAGEAVTTAERRKMKCVCGESQAPEDDITPYIQHPQHREETCTHLRSNSMVCVKSPSALGSHENYGPSPLVPKRRPVSSNGAK